MKNNPLHIPTIILIFFLGAVLLSCDIFKNSNNTTVTNPNSNTNLAPESPPTPPVNDSCRWRTTASPGRITCEGATYCTGHVICGGAGALSQYVFCSEQYCDQPSNCINDQSPETSRCVHKLNPIISN